MSILNQPIQPQEPTREQILANHIDNIKKAPARLADHMVREWRKNFAELWNPDDTFSISEKLSALDTDALELFQINTEFTTFLISQLSGKQDEVCMEIIEKLQSIPEVTFDNFGRVFLVSNPD